MPAVSGRDGVALAALLGVSVLATYPAYLWALHRQEAHRRTSELARFDADCQLARLRLAQGGEFWSARIMVNRCAAAHR